MATLRAAARNPVITPCSDRLRAARKLLHLAGARVTKEQDFDPAYAQRQHVGAPSSRTLNALPDGAVHTPVAPP